MIGENDTAIDFTLERDGGEKVTMDDYKGRYVVLYFYPKDNTPGCTTEANDFTAQSKEFDALNCVILGVSPDTVRKHDNFVKKYDLKVTLLADTEKELIESYGLWVEKKMYGRTYFGVERTTFLIDPEGKIMKVWRKVKVKGHVDEVLDTLKSLA